MHQNLINAHLFSEAQKTVKMIRMAVNPTRRNKAHQMQRLTCTGTSTESLRNDRVLAHRPFTDALTDTHHFLINNAPGSDVQMANFRAAHLSCWQPDAFSGSLQQGMRKFLKKSIYVWCAGCTNCVGFLGVVTPPTVQNGKHHRTFALCARLAFLARPTLRARHALRTSCALRLFRGFHI